MIEYKRYNTANELVTGMADYVNDCLTNAHGIIGDIDIKVEDVPTTAEWDSGFFVQGGLGYLFNRVRCEFGSYASPPPALAGDYLYGYDRMRGGFAWSSEIGYLFMSNSRILNFSLSLEFVQAYTQPMREWDFHLMEKDTKSYIDQYIGVRAAIYIPTYRRKPAEFYYN